MKIVEVVHASSVKVEALDFKSFLSFEKKERSEKITKKMVKKIAKQLKLNYSESEILFAKKIMTAYLKDRIV